MIWKIYSANRTLLLTYPYLNSLKRTAFYKEKKKVRCIESRWTFKHKPEVKLLTLVHVLLNSWALFLLSFWKSSPGALCSTIYQSRPHPSAAGRYNWHSSYQKSLQDSHSMELTLSCADFAIPSVSCQVQSQYGFTPGNLEMGGKKEELAPPSSESRAEMEFFLSYFLFLISHPAVKYHIMQSRLRN